MKISCFLGVWFPIWLSPDICNIAVAHPLRSPASIYPNQISLLGLFIIASSDCEWCLANGFSIQICWLDATEAQQGLSFQWRQQQFLSGVNRKEMTLLKYAFVLWLFLHLVRFVLIWKVLKWRSKHVHPWVTSPNISLSVIGHPKTFLSALMVQSRKMTHQMSTRKCTS